MSDFSTTDINLQDSISLSKEKFLNTKKESLSFPSNQVDAVVGFFENRGFDTLASTSVASVLLTQAKVDNANVMELLEQLKGYDKVKLTSLIVAILNANRSNISKLGYKAIEAENTDNLVSRNIMV
jgi:hypothetical protein